MKPKGKPPSKKRNGRRYSKDAIVEAVALYGNPRVPIECITEALGCSRSRLSEWAKERKVTRPELDTVGPGAVRALAATAEASRALMVEAGTVLGHRVRTDGAVAPAENLSQVASAAGAAVKLLSIGHGMAEAQPGGGAALVVYVAAGDMRRLDIAAEVLGVDREALVRAYSGAGPETLVVEGEKL